MFLLSLRVLFMASFIYIQDWGEWPSGLRRYILYRKVPVQTPLGTRSGS